MKKSSRLRMIQKQSEKKKAEKNLFIYLSPKFEIQIIDSFKLKSAYILNSNFEMTTKEYLTNAGEILSKIKPLAAQYHLQTGRPLGITGEMAEYEAVRILHLEISEVRQKGHDAIRKTPNSDVKIQIKGRVQQPGSKQGQRLGSIKMNDEWDAVILVLLDNNFNPREIYEANRSAIEEALTKPGSKARNERNQLSVSKFKSISKRIWTQDS